MLTYIKLAWRNILRNKHRTFIAGTAIGIGLAAMILTDAVMIGMSENLIKSATKSFLGEAQIHQEEFRENFEVEKTINNLEDVLLNLKNDSIVEHFTVRTLAIAMISSPANVSAVSMVGINPETEKYLSQIDEAIIEGEYFTGENVSDVSGLRVDEMEYAKEMLPRGPIVYAIFNPALALHDKMGEIRFGMEKFGEAIR